MRNWQRDRNRRRKKPAEGSTEAQPQHEPLQPIYPDLKPDESVAEQLGRDEGEGENIGNRIEPAEPPGASEPVQPREEPQRKRRRRGRGGRGRTSQQQAAADAAAPPSVVSEVAPELPAATTALPSASRRQQRPARQQRPGQPQRPTPPQHPTPLQPPTQPQRPPRGIVVLAIGLPGSGKSSWFKRRGVTALSSDLLRALLFDNITEQKYQDLVFGTLRSLLRARLIARMPWNYVDATNLSPKERAGWIKMAKEFGYEAHAVFFDVPLQVCKDRNLRRARMVPDEIMERFAEKLRPPTFEEGFSKIIVVRVKKRDEEPTSEML
jgi:predicted kinase